MHRRYAGFAVATAVALSAIVSVGTVTGSALAEAGYTRDTIVEVGATATIPASPSPAVLDDLRPSAARSPKSGAGGVPTPATTSSASSPPHQRYGSAVLQGRPPAPAHRPT